MPQRILNVAEKNSVAKAIVAQLSASQRADRVVSRMPSWQSMHACVFCAYHEVRAVFTP
jgi:hypothetical protein